MKILNIGTYRENFSKTSFLTDKGISQEINRKRGKKIRYINMFEITSMYNTYKRGFLVDTSAAEIYLTENCFIGRAKGREQLAYYHQLITGEKEKYLNYEDLPIVIVSEEEFKEIEKDKLFHKEIRINEKIMEAYKTWKHLKILITKDKKIITTQKELKKKKHLLFEKYELTVKEKELIEMIVQSPEEERDQLLLNLLYFSYHFPIMSFEDLKNENYLILTCLLIKKKIEKPQMKIRNHPNLQLMYMLIEWVDKQRIKDYNAFMELDLLDVLNKLTEDNYYFLSMYLLHGDKDDFNINKYKDRTLFAQAVSKFMTLTSYKYKEQLALNFNYVRIINLFLKGKKRNELMKTIKLVRISSENRKEAALKRKSENDAKKAELQENSKPETVKAKIKTALKEGKNIYEIIRKLELPVYDYNRKKETTIVSLKKESGKSIIAKALENSWIKTAKTQKEINIAGSKASCCLHEGGGLSKLAKWINNNRHMTCLYGQINKKNFQILAYLKINLNPYRRTIVFDNIEANEKLTNTEYNSLLKEIKTKMRAYGLHVGIIRSDVEKFSLTNRHLIRDSIIKRKHMGITDETYYFHDSLEYFEEKKAVAFEIKKKLIVRKGKLSDLFQLTQLEKNTYGDYDNENTYVKEFINGNEEINVIADEDSNIYGYSIVRKIETCADLTDHVRNPEIILKIEKIKRMGIEEVDELIEKHTKEYTYIEDFNVIKELRKSKIVYDLARNTVDSIKKMSKDNKVHFHSNENSKHMEHFLLRKGFEAFNLGDIEKKEKKARRKVG